jgi:anti-sigma factor RsiW
VTHEPPSSEHLDLERLADLDEDLLTPPDTAAAEAHLAGCGECRQRRADIRTTRALLSTLAPEPMPATVAARVDAALAALPSTTIVPLSTKRRGWRAHPTMAGLGAAATVAALVGALVVARTSSHSTSGGSNGTTAGSAASQAPLPLPPSTVTGTKYTAANLANTVPALLAPAAARTAQTPAGTAPLASGGTATTAVPAGLDRLFGSSAALDACVRSVEAGGPLVKPLAIDFATYQGAPSLLIVLPGLEPGTIGAWFVGPGCDATNENLVNYKAVPTSSPAPSPGG